MPRTFADLLKPEYQNKVALNGSPLSSGSAVAGVFAAALANGGSLTNIEPGHRLLRTLKDAGNFIPVQATPQTIASGQTPVVIDWDYLNLAYIKEFPSAKIGVAVPSDGIYGALLLPGDQRHRPAPVGGAALAGVPLLRPGAAALAEGVLAPGSLHRHGRAQGRPEGSARRRSRRRRLREGEVRDPGPAHKAKSMIATEWPRRSAA